MLRLGEKYQQLVGGAGCSCCNPILQQVSRRLDVFSRRSFVAGLGAAAIAGCERPPSERAGAPSPPHTAAGEGAQTSTSAQRILLTRARVFDGKAGALRNAQVLVDGTTIASVDAANNAPPSDATVIDCGNRVLMPGLIDAHWHTLYAAVPMNVLLSGDMGMVFTLSTAEAQRTLMRGFTTVRDLGGPVFSFKQAIDTGVIPGPRIFPSGAMITTSGGHGDLRLPFEIPHDPSQLSQSELMGAAAIVDDVGGLRRAVREDGCGPAGLRRLAAEQHVATGAKRRRRIAGDLVEQRGGQEQRGDAVAGDRRRERRRRQRDVAGNDGEPLRV